MADRGDVFSEVIWIKDVPNKNLRVKVARLVHQAGEGHIPSSYSIIEVLSVLFNKFLKYDPKKPYWEHRDYFILSKGHGCAALWIMFEKHGFITQDHLARKCREDGILGGHPDSTKVPGIEASTGSLGHGIGIALGIALGLRIQKKANRVITLVGDGETNEGAVWECALVASNLKLGNFCVIVDNNGSAAQVLPVPNQKKKWESFGWEAYEIDGHDEDEIERTLKNLTFEPIGTPKVIIANTIKGKGVSFLELQGLWHSRVPTKEELAKIEEELS
jgi:transketolase